MRTLSETGWNLNPYLREFEADAMLSRTPPEAIDWFEYLQNLLRALGYQHPSQYGDDVRRTYFQNAADVDCDNPAYERLETVRLTVAAPEDLLEAIDTVSFAVNLLKGINP